MTGPLMRMDALQTGLFEISACAPWFCIIHAAVMGQRTAIKSWIF
jgi:hypothetical protein